MEDPFEEANTYNEESSMECQQFYDMLEELKKHLWNGCANHSTLSILVIIKPFQNAPQDIILHLIDECSCTYAIVLKSYCEAKKLVSRLVLVSK